jgi:transcription-repair coupling factor (superfamily II helicase)
MTPQRALDALRDRFDIDTRRSALFQDLKAGPAPAGIEYYLPLFFETPRGAESTATLFDYLVEGCAAAARRRRAGPADHVLGSRPASATSNCRHDIERPILRAGRTCGCRRTAARTLNRGDRIEVCARRPSAPWRGAGTRSATSRRRRCRWRRRTTTPARR